MASPAPTITLFCWILRVSNLSFSVIIQNSKTVDHLKHAILKAKPSALVNFDVDDLKLWKVSTEIDRGLKDEVTKLPFLDDNRLLEGELLSDIFPHPEPLPRTLHIVVQLQDLYYPLAPPPEPPSSLVLRTDTVSALYQRLDLYQLIQVRGTPASGKTSLAQLLSKYIHQQEPATNVIWIQDWSPDEVYEKGRSWARYLQTEKGWDHHEKTVFVFDDAQLTYEDVDLWHNLFKSIHMYPDYRVILFASYGTPSTRVYIQGTGPIIINDRQRVTLRALQHEDDLPPVGLFFTRMEFDDLVSKLYPSTEYRFDGSFFNALFDLTEGHVGAIHAFMTVILGHESYRTITGRSYTWSLFLKKVIPRALVEALGTSVGVFSRGLPLSSDLCLPSLARVFFSVLSTGFVMDAEFTGEDDKKALSQCFHNGWLHADRLDHTGEHDQFGYFFSSPLHRWYIEWKLQDTLPATPLKEVDIPEFIIGVIARFSASNLSATERRMGPGGIQRSPEAQYQDEFYRCCSAYSSGSLLTFPEYGLGTAKGRVDFYIPAKQWGVELVRDASGDQLARHSGRFSSPGLYETALQVSDYVILDFRVTKPPVAHLGLQKLHHIVFSKNFRHVRVLDRMLELVPGGDFMLTG